MAITKEFFVSAEQGSSGAACTTAATDATGSDIIIMVGVYDNISASLDSISDSEGNTWTLGQTITGGAFRCDQYYCINPTTSATQTFTVDYSAVAGDTALTVHGFSSGSSIEIGTTGADTNGFKAATSFSITPTDASNLIYSYNFGSGLDTNPTLGSGQTQLDLHEGGTGIPDIIISTEATGGTSADTQSFTHAASHQQGSGGIEMYESGLSISAEGGTYTLSGADVSLGYTRVDSGGGGGTLNLGRWTGGSTSLLAGTSWAAPNGLFPTQQRNDNSAYTFTSSTSTLTLPSSDLADGYLIIAKHEHLGGNNRIDISTRIQQTGGTGTFANGNGNSFGRNSNNNDPYTTCWGFVDNPSASATFQFQWLRDSDSNQSGTVKSVFEVIPLWYDDVGIYTSSNATITGGTTPTQVTGFSGTDGTNITISSNVISVTGDNKRYLCLGGLYSEGIGSSRTQRWAGFRIDGTKDDTMKGYCYARNGSNDRIGINFLGIIETVTATRTIDMFCYRGDGVGANQGGADVDGNTAGANEDHAMVVIELTDDTDVIWADNTGGGTQSINTTSNLDLNVANVVNFNDSASFTKTSNTQINAEQDMDALVFANIGAASNAVSSGSRGEMESRITVNGTEDTDLFHGNYIRGNQGSQDTFGWSAHPKGFVALTSGDDVGASVIRTGDSHLTNSQPGWTGLGLINLDTVVPSGGSDAYNFYCASGQYYVTGSDVTLTLDAGADPVIEADGGSYTVTGTDANLELGTAIDAESGSYSLVGSDVTLQTLRDVLAEGGAYNLTGTDATLRPARVLDLESGTYVLNGSDVGLNIGARLESEAGIYTVTGTDVDLPRTYRLDAESGAYVYTGSDVGLGSALTLDAESGAYTITGNDVDLLYGQALDAEGGTYLLSGTNANLEYGRIITIEGGSYVSVGSDTDLQVGRVIDAENGSYSYTGADVNLQYSGADKSVLAEGGTYTLTGSDATLVYVPSQRRFFIIS